MKSPNRQSLGFLSILLLAVVVMAGCAPNANAQLISPQLGEQLYAEEADSVIEAEPTPAPMFFAELTPEQINAGLPDDFAAALASADASNGETVALLNGCGGCHNVDPAITLTGPTWHNLADTAANREPGVGPAQYLYESIINPGAYLVADYPGGVMPATFGETISTEDMADLVAYLLTLHE